VDAATPRLARLLGPVHGVALALYFVLLPLVVAAQWSRARTESHGVEIRALLVGLSLFWVAFLYQFTRDLVRQRRGEGPGRGGSAWLAGLVLAAVALVGASGSSHPTRASFAPSPVASAPASAVAMAIAARRRADAARRGDYQPGDDADVEAAIEELRGLDPALLEGLRARVGEELDGEVDLAPGAHYLAPADPDPRPLVVCVVAQGAATTRVAFAREGGRLAVPPEWDDAEVALRVTGLHEGGRVEMAHDEAALVRALATRAVRRSVVVYIGDPARLDDELRASAVVLAGRSTRGGGARDGGATGEVRVELLRAEPRVVGLVAPFAPTLRRRSVEMAAYLALHRHEPVTGERLRARVLGHGEADATSRTLANVASSLRRALGVDERGPRLHPVSSSGLYATHALTSDVEAFEELVARARRLDPDGAAPLLRAALDLVRGEPLASALKGFEWFLAEGHAARLQRDGEWAALALHHWALGRGEVEVAFEALAAGRLLDPYSDALAEAQARVPRLREFGGDRPRGAQDRPVGTGRAVAVSGPRERLGAESVE
jgi:hypothetical protein